MNTKTATTAMNRLRREARAAQDRILKATDLAVCHGTVAGERHKAWIIDQMLRALAGEDYGRIVAGLEETGEQWDEGVQPPVWRS